MRPGQLTDGDLVRRCREGNEEAWNELVERFARYINAICTRGFGLSGQDAEDAFQEVFVRIYARLETLRDDSAIRPWIAQLARRVCLDRLATTAAEPLEDVPDEEVEHVIEEIDEAFTVRQALEQLGEPCHEMLDRFFARDESYRTISTELGLPSGTIASRISRCLEKLRGELEGRNPPQPASGDQ